ncbi:hypothetical protein [Holophaga foetida]|uniref:hypothetical protein n=1 Tax=Holophaga foetida TaxID=35839 RepID=UPI0002472F39|nr:hypothetical protein [Holophaga foetida]
MHDELRIPLYAGALGFEVAALPHIYREIKASEEMQFFNCKKIPVRESTIRRELAKPDGRRVFHPCARRFRLKKWWLF